MWVGPGGYVGYGANFLLHNRRPIRIQTGVRDVEAFVEY